MGLGKTLQCICIIASDHFRKKALQNVCMNIYTYICLLYTTLFSISQVDEKSLAVIALIGLIAFNLR